MSVIRVLISRIRNLSYWTRQRPVWKSCVNAIRIIVSGYSCAGMLGRLMWGGWLKMCVQSLKINYGQTCAGILGRLMCGGAVWPILIPTPIPTPIPIPVYLCWDSGKVNVGRGCLAKTNTKTNINTNIPVLEFWEGWCGEGQSVQAKILWSALVLTCPPRKKEKLWFAPNQISCFNDQSVYPVQVGGGVVQMDPELLVHCVWQSHVLK